MNEDVLPSEREYHEQQEALVAAGKPHQPPAMLGELIAKARTRGLWNLFLAGESGLSNVDYAVLAEETGRSPFIAPAAMNCLSPDSGNMEMLAKFGTAAQKEQWLTPLLDGNIRSAFSMTEPDVASSDATNIRTTIESDGDEWVINGRKWFTTGAADPRSTVLFVLGVSHPEAERRDQHTLLIVPKETAGVEIRRNMRIFGFLEQQGHSEVEYSNVRVPRDYVLGEVGQGLAVVQGRLGPGRIHHCMRAIGMAERALDLMCRRAQTRKAFGSSLSDFGVLREKVAQSRLEIDQARLLVMHCAWKVDQVGVEAARTDISAIKIVAPLTAERVLDRAIQIHGAAGVTEDFPLAEIWTRARTLRIADGPEDVHMRAISRREFARYHEGKRKDG